MRSLLVGLVPAVFLSFGAFACTVNLSDPVPQPTPAATSEPVTSQEEQDGGAAGASCDVDHPCESGLSCVARAGVDTQGGDCTDCGGESSSGNTSSSGSGAIPNEGVCTAFLH